MTSTAVARGRRPLRGPLVEGLILATATLAAAVGHDRNVSHVAARHLGGFEHFDADRIRTLAYSRASSFDGGFERWQDAENRAAGIVHSTS